MESTFTPTLPQSEDRKVAAQRIAAEKFQGQPDWVVFFREIFGVDGILRKLFPSTEDMQGFEKSAEYAEIQNMLSKLREKSTNPTEDKEPTRVITVRLPKSLHEFLKQEAHDRHTSINQLCIAKLLRVISGEEEAEEGTEMV